MDNLPITDEQAKALAEAFKFGGQSLETARKFGSYLAKTLGTVPEDLVGLLGGDWLRYKRAENLVRIHERAGRILTDRRVEPEPVPLALALPLMADAADESRPELVELWARLLAAAEDPARVGSLRRAFIETVKLLDPLDARVLNALRERVPVRGPQTQDWLSQQLGISPDQAQISLQHLDELGCIRDQDLRTGRHSPFGLAILTAFGNELMRALGD